MTRTRTIVSTLGDFNLSVQQFGPLWQEWHTLDFMAQSLSPKCTPLKHEYDACFNAWFEGYLEPALPPSATAEQRAAYSKQKADEYEQRCGKIWKEYRDCVQVRFITPYVHNELMKAIECSERERARSFA
jgi:TRIAP1/MDM35 family protein